jgi:hypothetical protein
MADAERPRPFETTLQAVEMMCQVIDIVERLTEPLAAPFDSCLHESTPRPKVSPAVERKLKELNALRAKYDGRYRATADLNPSFPLLVLASERGLTETERRVFETALALVCRTTRRFEPSPSVGQVSRLVAHWTGSDPQPLLSFFMTGSKLVDAGLIEVVHCRPTVADWPVFVPRPILFNLLGCKPERGNLKPQPTRLQSMMQKLPKSMPPIVFFVRLNVVLDTFNHERFALISAFRPDASLESNLENQSKLVDAVEEAGLSWFPLVLDWYGEMRRSIYLHRATEEEARRRLNLHDGQVRLLMPEPTMELMLRLRKQCGFDSFALGDSGSYLVYEGAGDPPSPVAVDRRLQLNVDADFIKFRESQGHLVTQRVKEVDGG